MKLKDVIVLAKAGYKKADIEELLSIEVPEDTEPVQEETTEEKTEDEPATTQEEKEPEIDYKKLYEESQEKLKVAQKENVQKNIKTEDTSDEDVLADIIKSLR